MVSKLPRSAPRDAKRILVVDDEPRMIGFIRMNLELEGFQVLEASNGLEALEIVRTSLPDLVILDVMMPELDGFETLRILREFSSIPVIMLTAKGEDGCGRLHHQALQPQGAFQPRARCVAPCRDANQRA